MYGNIAEPDSEVVLYTLAPGSLGRPRTKVPAALNQTDNTAGVGAGSHFLDSTASGSSGNGAS